MLNIKEQKWIDRVQKALDACPESLKKRADSFTIGDPDITIFDKNKYEDSGADVGRDVGRCNAELARIVFPFDVASTAG